MANAANAANAANSKMPVSPNGSAPSPRRILALQNVTQRYAQGGPSLIDINLSLPQGSFLFLTGPSGSGKTTLLKLLYGAERPSEGSVVVNGQEIHRLKGDRLSRCRRQIGVVFQDYKLIPNRTVSENIAFALWAQGCAQSEIHRRLAPTLRLVGLQHKALCFPHQLSGGEQQRVSLARAIAGTPPLILADEPTGNLDPQNSQQVIRILNQLNRMGATVIMTTHDVSLVRTSEHPVVGLEAGQLSWLRKKHSPEKSQQNAI
ncbi:MAG: cell division ATP-binding protein FtsE [Synechococcales cyanobacterium RM1_1_8]|nr:cell division ATP-binding protein FtsE [Synechococcales cyanobacterium RM1_1_8]